MFTSIWQSQETMISRQRLWISDVQSCRKYLSCWQCSYKWIRFDDRSTSNVNENWGFLHFWKGCVVKHPPCFIVQWSCYHNKIALLQQFVQWDKFGSNFVAYNAVKAYLMKIITQYKWVIINLISALPVFFRECPVYRNCSTSNGFNRFTIAKPILPKPTMPTVESRNSWPKSHWDRLSVSPLNK